jgi:hypothetical protein
MPNRKTPTDGPRAATFRTRYDALEQRRAGNIYSGLWYPIIIAAMSFIVALIFLPEPKDRDINRI